jgi:broad specificity phosphatase PhoE
MELILVRHGETLWNKEGRVQGTSDIELSDTGRDQARRLALVLKDRPLDALYASPLKRALETASLINEYHGLTIETDRGLMEMDQGDFEGQPFKELMAKEKDFLKHWISDPASVTMPRGESFLDVQARSWPVVERIAARGQNALVVSHNFAIAAILCRIRNIGLSQFRSTCVDTASKTLIRVEDGLFSVESLNDRSHLEVSAP